MAERFENLDNSLHGYPNFGEKSIVEVLNTYEKHGLAGKRKIKPLVS